VPPCEGAKVLVNGLEEWMGGGGAGCFMIIVVDSQRAELG